LSTAFDELGRQKIMSERHEPSLEANGEAARDQISAEPSTGVNEQTSNGVSVRLWEQIFTRENLFRALARVEANKGAAGADGMTVEELRPYLQAHWLEVKADLDAGRYRPSPVKRVEIAKPDGGVRLLGIPTVLDRMIQQAVMQGLMPVFEPQFSEHSYGFRPGRSAQGAIRAAQTYIREGYEWVVDIDLEKFFDWASGYSFQKRKFWRVPALRSWIDFRVSGRSGNKYKPLWSSLSS
jgi:retron-type reverse transcriptase